MIDLHCHILPDVDDGSSGIDESLAMARQAVSDGIHTIIATPHALGGTASNPYEKIKKDVVKLQKRLEYENIPVLLCPGSEVYACPDMAERILNNETAFLCENRRYILIEFPLRFIPGRFQDELYRLRIKGVTPVIAHPERNPDIFHEKKILYELISMECLIQVNSTSITGGFGEDVMTCSHELLELRLAHIIASDAHSADKRPPVLSHAVKIAENILKDHAETIAMVDSRPKRILAGQRLEVPDTIRPKQKKTYGKRFWF